jgi:hypothetical protein
VCGGRRIATNSRAKSENWRREVITVATNKLKILGKDEAPGTGGFSPIEFPPRFVKDRLGSRSLRRKSSQSTTLGLGASADQGEPFDRHVFYNNKFEGIVFPRVRRRDSFRQLEFHRSATCEDECGLAGWRLLAPKAGNQKKENNAEGGVEHCARDIGHGASPEAKPLRRTEPSPVRIKRQLRTESLCTIAHFLGHRFLDSQIRHLADTVRGAAACPRSTPQQRGGVRDVS